MAQKKVVHRSCEKLHSFAVIRHPRIAALAAAAILITSLMMLFVFAGRHTRTPASPTYVAGVSSTGPAFVGAEACARCHPAEFKLWTGSHHQLAMEPASNATVLGNFDNVSYFNSGVTSTFLRRGGKFIVHTDGPDGSRHDYDIEFTFGVYPLQQYLIPLPGGRLQAFGLAWDSRPAVQGGQRWFSLYPNRQLSYHDPLHWTALDQNWNFMCADYYSTNVRKNYHPATRDYATLYSAINVACEACHGPGSNHAALMKQAGGGHGYQNDGLTVMLDERQNINAHSPSRPFVHPL